MEKAFDRLQLCSRSTLLCPSSIFSPTLSLNLNFLTSYRSPTPQSSVLRSAPTNLRAPGRSPKRDFLLWALLPQIDTLQFTMLLYQDDVIIKLLSAADFLKLI